MIILSQRGRWRRCHRGRWNSCAPAREVYARFDHIARGTARRVNRIPARGNSDSDADGAGGRLEVGVSAVLGFGAVLALASLAGVVARRGRRPGTLEEWALAGRRNGGVATWFLLGGSIFTAYTYVAVPALVYGVGGLGYFAVPYTVVTMQLAFLVLPALWRRATTHGWLGPADV